MSNNIGDSGEARVIASIAYDIIDQTKPAKAWLLEAPDDRRLSEFSQEGPVRNNIIVYRGTFASRREAEAAVCDALAGARQLTWVDA